MKATVDVLAVSEEVPTEIQTTTPSHVLAAHAQPFRHLPTKVLWVADALEAHAATTVLHLTVKCQPPVLLLPPCQEATSEAVQYKAVAEEDLAEALHPVAKVQVAEVASVVADKKTNDVKYDKHSMYL